MKYVMCFFPWIGAVIGALSFGWIHLAAWLELDRPLRTILLMMIPVAVSGGIHLDGFLDTSDAMGSWRPRERRLEILKDSHAGAFAVISCTAYFFLLYGVLDLIGAEEAAVYGFTFVVSRSLSAFSVVTFPKASRKGTVAGFARSAGTTVIQAAAVLYLAVCAAGMLLLDPLCGTAAAAGAALTFVWYYRMAMKHFGGINGDLAGCFLTVCELVMPAAMAAASLLSAGR